jgi:hypothetical protein
MKTENCPTCHGLGGYPRCPECLNQPPAKVKADDRLGVTACSRWEDGPTPETDALMLENGRAIAQCKTRPPIWEKMKMMERERNLTRAQTEETLSKLRWMLKAAERQQEVNGDESPAMRYARVKCQQWADHFPENVKEHAPLSARASVDHGVDVEITKEHVNKAADRGCCVSTCCASDIWEG